MTLPISLPQPQVHLATSAAELGAIRRKLGITKAHDERPKWAHTKGTRGLTWTMDVDGHPHWIIGVDPSLDPLSLVSTLAHESVHVWQGWRAHISEESPSAEFEAYSIEGIFKALMIAYAKKRIKTQI